MARMGNPGRIAIAAAGVAIAVVLFLILRPGGDEGDVSPAAQETTGQTDVGTETGSEAETETGTETGGATTSPTTTDGGAPDVVQARITIGPDGPGGVQRIDATRNQRVVLTIRSEITDHVHVHGYDLFADVGPGQPAKITFRADVPGRFEIELEDLHQQIADLRVAP